MSEFVQVGGLVQMNPVLIMANCNQNGQCRTSSSSVKRDKDDSVSSARRATEPSARLRVPYSTRNAQNTREGDHRDAGLVGGRQSH